MSSSNTQTRPGHGFTKLGIPVHRRTSDHLPSNSAYQRFNKLTALWLTNHVGTMTCFWVFFLIALVSLPAVLTLVWVGFKGYFPAFLIAAGMVALIAWISSNFLQLVLLPSIMVGQNLQAEASDARAAKTFEYAQSAEQNILLALDALNIDTAGGLQVLCAKLDEQGQVINRLVSALVTEHPQYAQAFADRTQQTTGESKSAGQPAGK